MNIKFRLVKLTLIGNRKNYEVPFKDGLNYISGPTSTGKTSILEMINYVLGAETHKDYIEIGQCCSSVELELLLSNQKFKIRRKLFDFNQPVSVFVWNTENQMFDFLDRLEIDSPSNPKSLPAFILEKLNLSNLKVANQCFSFRDLFKYSYLKQTEIDNENIMGEKNWTTSIKRKPTFEIIFNIYDELLADLKASIKDKNSELRELELKISGINEFLANTDILDLKTYFEKRKDIETNIQDRQKKLLSIKTNNTKEDELTLNLQKRIVSLKSSIEKIEKNVNDQKQYINKLILLRNQYSSEIDRIDFIIEGFHVLDKVDFVVCPGCLQTIEASPNITICNLCGKEHSKINIDEVLALKHEKYKVSKKLKELLGFIIREEDNLELLIKQSNELKVDLLDTEKELLFLHKDYVNPYVEQIEQLSYEVGEQNRILRELENNHRMLIELDRFNKLFKSKEKAIEDLKQKIKDTESTATNKADVINNLSDTFYDILEAFKFPKLDTAYIDEKHYLPHVRGRLYRELGSLAGVTLITMAYYLSLLIDSRGEKFNHLGLLIIDSPRKNLGAKSDDDDFKDEEIFNSIIRFFIEVDKNYGKDIQLIVVNNGYPSFLDKTNIVKEFDGDGTKELPYGLIDDIED